MDKRVFAIAALSGALALPAAASARTYTVSAGDPGAPPASAPEGTTLNAFLPARIKVRSGDRITYENRSFHTVSILGRNVDRPPIAVPDPAGGTYSGINAPDGSPFFFNGLPRFIYNPDVFAPIGDTTVDDRETHSSGAFFPQDGPVGEYTLRFERPGSYRVLCLLHPGMRQRVKVLKSKARGADRPAKVRRAITKQARKRYKAAGKAVGGVNPPNVVRAGVSRSLAAVLAFLPKAITVPTGTTVEFINQDPTEVHNMVFGPPEYVQSFQQQTDLFPMGPGTPNQVSPPFIYGSEPTDAEGILNYDGADYGNGFMWTPLMDDQPGSPPAGLPGSQKIRFNAPGTFNYFCAIHGDSMAGQVVVQ